MIRTSIFGWLATLAVGCATERPADWSYLHAAIVAPSCATANCHSRLAAVAGVDLSTKEGAYATLTGHVCGVPRGAGDISGDYVFPYAPERSRLVYLLRGEGSRIMPPDVPLPAVEVDLVEQWIAEGATCD